MSWFLYGGVVVAGAVGLAFIVGIFRATIHDLDEDESPVSREWRGGKRGL